MMERNGEKWSIPITKPSIGAEEAEAAGAVIRSGWLSQGPKVKEFEERFAGWVNAPHACAVSSCTTALHLAFLVAGVRPGDVVLTVSHSFIATANSIRYCGAEPVFIDVDRRTCNMDMRLLEQCVEEHCTRRNGTTLYNREIDRAGRGPASMAFPARVGAICVVHQMGFPCDVGFASALAARLGIPLIEDAACAIGSELSTDNGATWKKVGAPHGDIACFSFHPRKVITTGEGGMLTTAKSRYDRQFRLLRQHAMSVPDTVRHGAKKVIFEEYGEIGFNYRMSDIQAAVGIEQIGRLDVLLEQRRKRADRYHRLLRDSSLVVPYAVLPWMRPNWQSYPVFIADTVALSQKEIMQRLLDDGISTRRGIMNAHQEQAYGLRRGLLPQSEYARDHTLLLPLYPSMTDEEQDAVVSALNACAHERPGTTR